MFPSYRNQSVDLFCKSADWFLYDMMGTLVVKGLNVNKLTEGKMYHNNWQSWNLVQVEVLYNVLLFSVYKIIFAIQKTPEGFIGIPPPYSKVTGRDNFILPQFFPITLAPKTHIFESLSFL